jgi:hypothetical protein
LFLKGLFNFVFGFVLGFFVWGWFLFFCPLRLKFLEVEEANKICTPWAEDVAQSIVQHLPNKH